MGSSGSKRKTVNKPSRLHDAADYVRPRAAWESSGSSGTSEENISDTASDTSSSDSKVTSDYIHDKYAKQCTYNSGTFETTVTECSFNEKTCKFSSSEINEFNKKGNELQRVSRDYPVSEAEKMLHMYKKERKSDHVSANMNKKDKTKHKPKPQYKTSNIYEIHSRRLCTPSQVESDMVVHPSTSNEKVDEDKDGAVKSNVDKASSDPEDKPLADKGTDNSVQIKKEAGLTRNVLDERSDYITKEVLLKPVSTGKLGSEKMKLWQELVEQGMLLPEQWSELNHKQQEAMTELVSAGLLARNEEPKYSMSIGAPLRRPPPRLNQIPPMAKPNADFTELFSTKIPDIITNTAKKENETKSEIAKTNIIVVSEADDKQKAVNVDDEKSKKHTNELHTEIKLHHKDKSQKPRHESILLANARSTKQSSATTCGRKFIDKDITVEKDRPCVTFASETSVINPSDSGTCSLETTREESEYFEALNGKRYSETQKRKLRLWDVDMI